MTHHIPYASRSTILRLSHRPCAVSLSPCSVWSVHCTHEAQVGSMPFLRVARIIACMQGDTHLAVPSTTYDDLHADRATRILQSVSPCSCEHHAIVPASSLRIAALRSMTTCTQSDPHLAVRLASCSVDRRRLACRATRILQFRTLRQLACERFASCSSEHYI